MSAADTTPRGLTAAVRGAAVLAALFVGVHVFVTRPTAFPAGGGFTLGGGALAGALADPRSLRLTRPHHPSRY